MWFPDLREQNQVFINSDLITVLFGCMCVCVFSSIIKCFVRVFILNYYSPRKHQYFSWFEFLM